jgi:hypothetical protein
MLLQILPHQYIFIVLPLIFSFLSEVLSGSQIFPMIITPLEKRHCDFLLL